MARLAAQQQIRLGDSRSERVFPVGRACGHNSFDGVPDRKETLSLIDPLRLSVVSKAIEASNHFVDVVAKTPGPRVDLDGTVIELVAPYDLPTRVFGKRNIGRCIFENANVAAFEGRLGKFDALLCGSNWNANILREQTGRDAGVIFEGIDPSLFCPGARSGIMDPDKFYIFSGGKVELRKGQDLVLRAFKEFSRRHDNAVLVTAWHSPWPKISAGFKGTLDAPLELDDKGLVNIKKWVTDNGIDPSRVIEIFSTPNQLMPTLLREIHVALQPSRAEACTNLPAMEAMACGVPVIVGDNTGMKDLITEDNCVACPFRASFRNASRITRQRDGARAASMKLSRRWRCSMSTSSVAKRSARRDPGGFTNTAPGRSTPRSSRTSCCPSISGAPVPNRLCTGTRRALFQGLSPPCLPRTGTFRCLYRRPITCTSRKAATASLASMRLRTIGRNAAQSKEAVGSVTIRIRPSDFVSARNLQSTEQLLRSQLLSLASS